VTSHTSGSGRTVFNVYDWEAIDWDDPDDEDGNYTHCMRHGVTETVVYDVLRERPVQITISPTNSDYAITGPDGGWSTIWTVLFDQSWKRGDWLRPVTGWLAKVAEMRQWESSTGLRWRGRHG
jgi:hypothetical protein